MLYLRLQFYYKGDKSGPAKRRDTDGKCTERAASVHFPCGIRRHHLPHTWMCSFTRKLTGALASQISLGFHYIGVIDKIMGYVLNSISSPLHYLEVDWLKAPILYSHGVVFPAWLAHVPVLLLA